MFSGITQASAHAGNGGIVSRAVREVPRAARKRFQLICELSFYDWWTLQA
jgi:type IV secretory pathway TrbL component